MLDSNATLPRIRKYEDSPLYHSLQFEDVLAQITEFHKNAAKTHKDFRTLVIIRFDRNTKETRITTAAHEPWEYMDQLMDYIPEKDFETRIIQALREVVIYYEMDSVIGGTKTFTEVETKGSPFLYAISELSSMNRKTSNMMAVVFSPQDTEGENWHMVQLPNVE